MTQRFTKPQTAAGLASQAVTALLETSIKLLERQGELEKELAECKRELGAARQPRDKTAMMQESADARAEQRRAYRERLK